VRAGTVDTKSWEQARSETLRYGRSTRYLGMYVGTSVCTVHEKQGIGRETQNDVRCVQSRRGLEGRKVGRCCPFSSSHGHLFWSQEQLIRSISDFVKQD